MTSLLDQLREMSVVVADTGDLAAVRRFRPVDCTTNPSLVLKALSDPTATDLVESEIGRGVSAGLSAEKIAQTLTVALGAQLTTLVPGRVSTEVEAALSFDAVASRRRAHAIVEDYARRGIEPDRILVKLAATWEGIEAARHLEAEGINCNLTLVFSPVQARACADAGVFLISPFVGRITDWHKARTGDKGGAPGSDPGVRSVREIYQEYKSWGVETIVMAASFRAVDQIVALAGCDRLTIAPSLLEDLESRQGTLDRAVGTHHSKERPAQTADESGFRWAMASDAMANEKLAAGIIGFDVDYRKLVAMIADEMTR